MAKTKIHRKHKGLGGAKARASALSAAAPKRLATARQSGDAVVVEFDYRQPGASVGMPYDSLLQAVDIVKSGLPVVAVSRLQKTSGLTLERIKQVARISEGSFSRRKQTGRLSEEESERLLRLSQVFERATTLHDGDREEARQWLETQIPSLGNQRPLDLARTEPGAREVEDLIGRIEHGIVS